MAKVCILSSVHIALDNRVFYREAQSLRRNGYEVTLIAVHEREEVKDGVRIVPLPRVARWKRPFLWHTLFQLAVATQADIYHFHDPELLLVAPWIRWRTGKPTVYDIHEVYPDFIKVKDYMPAWLRYPIAWAFYWLEPLLARLQSGLVFSDDEIAKTFAGVKRPKTTLFNFPSLDFVQTGIAQTQQIANREPMVLHLGGHERNRGTRLMMAAFEQVLKTMPEAKLCLVGHFVPPQLAQEVWEDAMSRGITHAVQIVGRVPFETIGNYLQRAAVGWVPWQAYPKNDKNIPTKLFEYMSYGLPIVSSDLASTRPFIQQGVNGFLVQPDDPSAHAQAILRVLQDAENGRMMGQHGQEMVSSQYNWGEMEKRLLALYEKLLAEKLIADS